MYSYEVGFLKAVFTFRHQTVFDPASQRTVPLMPYPPNCGMAPPEYVGALLSQEEAVAIASGEMNPLTHGVYSRPESMAVEMPGERTGSGSTFLSPFISISFKALIEKPSQRGVPMCSDLDHLNSRGIVNCSNSVDSVEYSPSMSRKREVVMESPPRKRPQVKRVFESVTSADGLTNTYRFEKTTVLILLEYESIAS